MTTGPGLVDALLGATDVGARNRARLAFQRDATPLEVADAWSRGSGLPTDAGRWLERLHEYTFWERPDPEPFVRVQDDPSWCEYRGPAGPEGRELVVAFAGAADNVLQPAPVVLQRLDARVRDLVIVRDVERRSYAGGVGAIGDLPDLVTRIRRMGAAYRSVVTIGTSMGGAAAIHVGVAVGARRAVSLGGRMPAPDLAAELRAAIDTPPRGTVVVCAFGAGNADDREGAESLRDAFPGAVLLPIADIDQHNVLHAAFQRGFLAALWDALLDEDLVPRSVAGTEPADAGPGTPDRRFAPTTVPPPWALPTLGTSVTRLRRLPVLGRLLATRAGRRIAGGMLLQPRVLLRVERLVRTISGRRSPVHRPPRED